MHRRLDAIEHLMSLSKNQIIAAKDSQPIEVEVPEWGGSILLRPMTGTARNDYEFWAASEHSKNGQSDFRGIRERLIIAHAVDDQGESLFSLDDLEQLSAKNAEVIDRLHNECQKLSGLTAEAVDDAAKN